MKASMTENSSPSVFDCCGCIPGHITDPQYKATLVGFCITTLGVRGGPVMVCKKKCHVYMYIWMEKEKERREISIPFYTQNKV